MKRNNVFYLTSLIAFYAFSICIYSSFKQADGLVLDIPIPQNLTFIKHNNEPSLSKDKDFIVIGYSLYPINFGDIDASIKEYSLPRTYINGVLTEHGNIVDTDETLLIRACQAKDIDAVEYLIKHGANVNKKVKSNGYTPLLYACETNSLDLTTILINAGADVNIETGGKENITPLILVALNKNKQLAQLLINAGASLKNSIRIIEKELKSMVVKTQYDYEDQEVYLEVIVFLKKFLK